MKGPIVGGTVQVFEIVSSATLNPRANIPRIGTTVLAQTTTGSNGKYSLAIPTSVNSGSLMVQITGGSYADEATGQSREVATQFGATGLRAVFGYTQGTPVSAAVTPFTEMAVADMGPNPTVAMVNASNAKIAAAFGLPDIIATEPLDPTQPFPAGSTSAAQQYALALATISQYQKDFGAGQTMTDIFSALTTQVNDPANNGGLAPATETQVDASSNNFAGGANNPNPVLNTPALNPAAPASVAIASDTATAVTSSSTVVVTVTLLTSGGVPVPEGTVVNFTAPAGSTLSGATTTNAAGSATVNLSSTVAGPVVVTATAGGASNSVTVPFIVQPTLATLKLSTSGTLAAGAGIGSIAATLNFAGGKGLSTRSAATSGTAATDSLLEANFTNPLQPVVLGLLNSKADPVTQLPVGLKQLGEVITVTFDIAAGLPVPTLADFTIANGYRVMDLVTGTDITGVQVVVTGVTLQ